MEILMSIGERLRNIRKVQGLNQEDIARRAGVSQSYIGQVERGEQNLTIDSLDRILRALGISFNELVLYAGTTGGKSSTIGKVAELLQSCSQEDQLYAER